jgi:hypothetical protein
MIDAGGVTRKRESCDQTKRWSLFGASFALNMRQSVTQGCVPIG